MTAVERAPEGSSRGRRVAAVAAAGARAVARDPVLVGVLVVLPAYFVGAWGWIAPAGTVPVEVPTADGTATVAVAFDALLTALVVPVTTALVAGVAGLFLVRRSRAVDDRLRVVGFRTADLAAARLCVLAAVVAGVAVVAVAVGWLHLAPEHPAWFLAAAVLAGSTYGALGALAGRAVGRTGGVYLMLFGPTLDLLLLQSPLGDAPAWATWLPGHHAAALAQSAAFAPSVAVGHAGWALCALAALAVLAAAAALR